MILPLVTATRSLLLVRPQIHASSAVIETWQTLRANHCTRVDAACTKARFPNTRVVSVPPPLPARLAHELSFPTFPFH